MNIIPALIFTLLVSSVASAQVTWQNSRGGSGTPAGPSSGTATGTKSWSASIPLSPGQNNITITATDGVNIAVDSHVEFFIPTFPGNALVLALGFEGNGTDSSGAGNNASLINGATYTPNGKFGQGLSLDGINDYAQVADSATLDLTQSFSISAWVNPAVTVSTWRTVATKNYMYYLYAAIDGECGSGGILGGLRANGALGPETIVCDPTPIPINTWTHLAVTYDGLAASNNLCLYKMGLLLSCVTLATVPGIMEPSNNTLTIGTDVIGTFFQGGIDELRIHNRAIPRLSTDGQNAAPGDPCIYGNPLLLAHQGVVQEMNCPVIQTVPPLQIKFPAGATGLKVGASGTGLKFGQP